MKNSQFILLSFLFFSLLNIEAKSQSTHASVKPKCYTMEMHALREKKDTGLKLRMEAFEHAIQQRIDYNRMRNFSAMNAADTIITIPVVVHVIHSGEAVGTGTNISDAQIISQIEVLNEDFRRMNADTSKIDVSFKSLGADIKVEFCLAKQDEDGLPTNGITRTYKATSGFSDKDKSLAYWPSHLYLNIWVADLGAGFLGYAQFPDSSGLPGLDDSSFTFEAETDGVAISPAYFGRNTGTATEVPNNLGRTTIHEVGHWLGLRHIWGDGPCGEDDFVLDTPDGEDANSGCPQGTIACGTLSMIENYMDYTDDSCHNIFTLGQKERMRTVLEVSPRKLGFQSSKGCVAANLKSNNIAIKSISVNEEVCASESISPEIMVRNVGVDTITSFTVKYSFDNGTINTYQWTGSIGTGDTAFVSLNSIYFYSGSHTAKVYVHDPNNLVDSDNTNDTLTSSFTVINGKKFTMGLKLDLYGTETSWIMVDTLTNDTLYAGDNYEDFTMSFIDKNFCLEAGCYRFSIFDSAGNGLCCNGWIPEWDGYVYIIDDNSDTLFFADEFGLSASALICATTGVNTSSYINNPLVMYPNPTKDILNINFNRSVKNDYKITIHNVIGQAIENIYLPDAGNTSFILDFSDKPQGVYFLNFTSDNSFITKKIVVY